MKKTMSFLLASLFALAAFSSAEAQAIVGWSAGPAQDATMAVGQRFECDDADCDGGLTCLYAAAPPRPAGARWLKTNDVTNSKVWPWRSVETWLGTKLNEVADNTIEDPSLPVSEWATRDTPIIFDIDGEGFARRVYTPHSKRGSLTVPIWFWTSEGRLFTMFCAIESRRISEVRAPIHRLLGALHPGEPVRDDIPTHF
ncbi:hypothetical protein FP2506_08676 [Fulvimarina pelagi HTCC2506]|uniref:Uncharacterized protein n=1 Tax=Fulvimarina pelagi HTCC2506 TaxID=314231 RepID=Q0G611_9HYPH|nr:hypothetical protein [Fulvimarina pelagi]EAU42903.1 hypothetical protein FP2506_08676 [Fulvimarina pelagi HTCC2506]